MLSADGKALEHSPKVGWRVREFARAVGLSRAYIWEQIAAGRIRTVKAGSARIILTQPHAFLGALAKEKVP